MLGQKIKIARIKQGYKQSDLARLLSVSPVTIGKWENDVIYPSTKNLLRIANVLDVSVDFLTTQSEQIRHEVNEDRNIAFLPPAEFSAIVPKQDGMKILGVLVEL